MPLYQVVQTTSPQKGLFDLVIVDEASQSGPEALLLNYIGDKMLVVGDDKQITPSHVGINRDDVTRLKEMHLQGIPHREAFDLESSFFSQAELRFPDRERLRRQIVDASLSNRHSRMPPFGRHQILTAEEIELIMDYLYTL